MIHSHTTKNGNKRYRYYVCVNAQKRGWHNCPSKSIPAAEIERFVIDQVRKIVQEPELLSPTIEQLRSQVQTQLSDLAAERIGIEKDLKQAHTEIRTLVTEPFDADSSGRQADLLDRIRISEQRLTEIREEANQLRGEVVTEEDVKDALTQFDLVWESLSPREQARVLALLIERVDYDGAAETVAVSFRPTGFKEIATELEFEESAA
jgi:site-specific DNA recombinase